MRNEDGFSSAAALLPSELKTAALSLPATVRNNAEELRLRAGRVPTVLCKEAELPFGTRAVRASDLDSLLERATGASAHTALAGVRGGFVTVRGGIRVGLCGEASVADGSVVSLRRLSSAAVRIPRQVRDCADGVYPLIRGENALVVSPPGAGKTTLLRELARLCSGDGLRVCVIDERGELAGAWDGVPSFDLGERTDVMTGSPKSAAASMLLRSMNPQVLVMDEIALAEDERACRDAFGCGVLLLASCHAASTEDLKRRTLCERLIRDGVFRRAVVIERSEKGRKYTVEEL